MTLSCNWTEFVAQQQIYREAAVGSNTYTSHKKEAAVGSQHTHCHTHTPNTFLTHAKHTQDRTNRNTIVMRLKCEKLTETTPCPFPLPFPSFLSLFFLSPPHSTRKYVIVMSVAPRQAGPANKFLFTNCYKSLRNESSNKIRLIFFLV